MGTSSGTPPQFTLRQVLVFVAALAGVLASIVAWLKAPAAAYNTVIVLAGTTILGVAAGMVGVFLLLRKRSLAGDVIGHASLPGVAMAYLITEAIWPGHGRWLPGLLLGAAAAGMSGILCMAAISRFTRVKEDAALAISLGAWFGLGMVLLTILQSIPTGSKAGLNSFIFGTTANMQESDVWVITVTALTILPILGLLFKEFRVLCFDEGFARAQGWPTLVLDLLLLVLVVAVTGAGAQSVGLVLVVALMIIPAAAARFWSDRLWRVALLAAAIGGLSTFLGATASALVRNLATGPVMVLAAGVFFIVSLLFGARRGVVWRWWHQIALARQIGRQDLMRAFYEVLEEESSKALQTEEMQNKTASLADLAAARAWTPKRLQKLLARARREGLVQPRGDGYALTQSGSAAARLAARNHRMWELYLIRHADVAAGLVDRAADQIEHVLDPEMIAGLEAELARDFPHLAVPPSPHLIKSHVY